MNKSTANLVESTDMALLEKSMVLGSDQGKLE